MLEFSIDHLPMIDYSGAWGVREQIRLPGESAAIRRLDTRDRGDMERMRELHNDSSVYKWFFPHRPWSDRELFGFCRPNLQEQFFAVSGIKGWVKPDEVGELQGWVSIDQVMHNDAVFLKNALGIMDDKWLFLEVGYARLPRARNKQISSGIRQACLLIPAFYNLARERGPSAICGWDYPQTIVAAYIHPDNKESIRLADACGFIQTPWKYKYLDGLMHTIYILEWSRLHNIYYDRSSSAVLNYFSNKMTQVDKRASF